MKTRYFLPIASIAISALISCNEILEIDPPTDALIAEDVYGNATNIKTAYTGLYSYHVHMNATYYQYMELFEQRLYYSFYLQLLFYFLLIYFHF